MDFGFRAPALPIVRRIEDSILVKAQNLISNGDFSNGTTGWSSTIGDTLTANNGTLELRPNGTRNYAFAYAKLVPAVSKGDKIYVRCKIRAVGSAAAQIYLRGGGMPSGSFIDERVTDLSNWHTLSGIKEIPVTPTGDVQGAVRVQYATTDASANQVVEIQYVMGINLTALFGVGKEPSIEEINILLNKYQNEWFNGESYNAMSPMDIYKILKGRNKTYLPSLDIPTGYYTSPPGYWIRC